MNRRFKRVYRHFSECEEYSGAMWKTVPIELREQMSIDSASLMIDAPAFQASCMRVLAEWPNSCEVNLTATVINHQAWMGHAACFLHHGAPEDLTRLGWRMLNSDQQEAANAAADAAILSWRDSYELANPKSVTRR